MTSPKVEIEREESLNDLNEAAVPNSQDAEDVVVPSSTADYQDDDLNIPPGRIHACRVTTSHHRLSSSGSNLSIPPNLQQQAQQAAGQQQQQAQVAQQHQLQQATKQPPSKQLILQQQQQQRDGVRSRSRSPSITTRDRTTVPSATQTTTDANSSISSLDEFTLDQDILYDRQGLVELDLSESQRKLQNSREFGVNLPPVNERLSEETLDDCHAFSDVVRSSNASRVSQGTGTDAVLEPLDECGEEDEDLDAIDEEEEGDQKATQPTVILTNMENLTLQHADDAAARAAAGVSRTGESSLMEEAPSGPTA